LDAIMGLFRWLRRCSDRIAGDAPAQGGLRLGPIPPTALAAVRQAIAERGTELGDRRALMLCGGPGGASYIDCNGEVWNHFFAFSDQAEVIEHVPDGSRKVGLVAIGAERIPELAEWLPRRPAAAVDCDLCKATGSLPPPLSQVQCPRCFGMGWLS
jgi:hypothetical protein